jgi:hypothetical protein
MVEPRSRPARAPVCGHDCPMQLLILSDGLRAVRDVRLTRLPAPVVRPLFTRPLDRIRVAGWPV